MQTGRRSPSELVVEACWASLPDWEHQIITAPRPALHACFNEADLLISDVPSVVSDNLAGEKPYAVANTGARFSEAARSPCAAADDHRARMEQRLLSLIPTQRGAEDEKAGAAVAGESSTSQHQA